MRTPSTRSLPVCVQFIAVMEVDQRAPSPDFAAGEARFFQKLRAAFSDLQTQCDNEKTSNQRLFDRKQQAIPQHIRDLETKCSDLAERRREIEEAEKRAALDLQKKRDEEVQSQRAHQESEERRRRKYSLLLQGDSVADVNTVLVSFSVIHATKSVCNTASG